MRRRKLLSLIAGAAVSWPTFARAQQPVVVGFLHPGSAADWQLWGPFVTAFRNGLKEMGYVEGQNLKIEYRWADNDLAKLPSLAADLVARKAAVIATVSTEPAQAAKDATKTIPIVAMVADNPIELGLVDNLPHPSGNVTGINIYTAELTSKRLGILKQLIPRASRVAVLVDPANGSNTASTIADAKSAAQALGLQLQIVKASIPGEIDAVFANFGPDKPDALLVDLVPFFSGRRVQLINLAAQHALPAMYGQRLFVEAGGLISYGTSLADAYRQTGVYCGLILKGRKPVDLPVLQPTKFEMLINLRTAKALDLSVPPDMLAIADDVIE